MSAAIPGLRGARSGQADKAEYGQDDDDCTNDVDDLTHWVSFRLVKRATPPRGVTC